MIEFDAAAVDAYVGIGSNLDSPVDQIERACELLATLPDSTVIARSSLYQSAPFGGIQQPDFVNAVIKMRTRLTATALLFELLDIERAQGRVRRERWGPRKIDLDMLLYGAEIIEQPTLVVPHPGIGLRNFVLLPLREIEPGLDIPGLGLISDIEIDKKAPAISQIA